jgi:hypothetical protein
MRVHIIGILKQLALVAVLGCIAQAFLSSAYASQDTSPLHTQRRCVGDRSKPGSMTVEFEMWVDTSHCNGPLYWKEFTVEPYASDGIRLLEPNSFQAQFDDNCYFKYDFEMQLPEQDTSRFYVWIHRPGGRFRACYVYFVTKPDTVECWAGYPRKRTRIEPDTTRYRVEMDLRDSVWFEGAKKYAERQGTKLVPSDSEGFYILRLPLNEVRALGGDGLNFRILDSLPPDDGSRASPHKWKTTPRGGRKHERPGKNKEDRSDAEIYIDSVAASDVQYLQAYMFSGGPAPVTCE